MVGVFDVIRYMYENSILLLFNNIYFTLVLEFMWFIQKKEFVLFFGTNFLLRNSG